VNIISRRHLFGAASALAATVTFGPELWAQAKDRLVIGISLEPPVLDPTKNAAAASSAAANAAAAKPLVALEPRKQVTVQAAGRGNPFLNLKEMNL